MDKKIEREIFQVVQDRGEVEENSMKNKIFVKKGVYFVFN